MRVATWSGRAPPGLAEPSRTSTPRLKLGRSVPRSLAAGLTGLLRVRVGAGFLAGLASPLRFTVGFFATARLQCPRRSPAEGARPGRYRRNIVPPALGDSTG